MKESEGIYKPIQTKVCAIMTVNQNGSYFFYISITMIINRANEKESLLLAINNDKNKTSAPRLILERFH